MTLSEHPRARILAALDAIPAGERSDIYVVSLYVYDRDDDPRRPTITVGYNSERQVAACTPAPGQKAKWPIASDPDEARWNYAFWLQNALAVVCDEESDPEGADLVQALAKEAGFWYSDEEEARDFEAALRKVEPLTGQFVQVAVGVVKDLHAQGELVRVLGRPVPVLIHETEYYEGIAAQNQAANPPCVPWGLAGQGCCAAARRFISSAGTSSTCVEMCQVCPKGSTTVPLRSP